MAVAVEAAILVEVMQRRVPFEYKLTHKTAMGRVPQYVFVYTMTVPLIAAEASHFCLGKSNQNHVRRNASCRCSKGVLGQAFARKPGETLGCNFFRRLTLSLHYPVCEKLLCPDPLHRLAGFSRFFSEALLRTGTTHSPSLKRALAPFLLKKLINVHIIN